MKTTNLKFMFAAIATCGIVFNAFATKCDVNVDEQHIVAIKNTTKMKLAEVNYVLTDEYATDVRRCGSLVSRGHTFTPAWEQSNGKQYVEAKINDKLSCQTTSFKRINGNGRQCDYDVIVSLDETNGHLKCDYTGFSCH